MEDKIKIYWNNRPCNIKHSSKKINTKEFFDEVEKKKYYVEPHILGFAEFKKYSNLNVLEVGCGIGTDSIQFARNNAKLTCLELSDVSLNICKERFKIYNLNANFILGNLKNNINTLNLKANSYDLIYSFGVIHHSPEYEQIVENVYKLLKPNGEFKLMLYATNSWKKIMIDNGLDQYEAQNNCPYAKTFTYEEVYKLLHKFKNVKIAQCHIFPYKIDEYKKNIYVKQDWFETMPDTMFKSLETSLGWHLCITCNK